MTPEIFIFVDKSSNVLSVQVNGEAKVKMVRLPDGFILQNFEQESDAIFGYRPAIGNPKPDVVAGDWRGTIEEFDPDPKPDVVAPSK